MTLSFVDATEMSDDCGVTITRSFLYVPAVLISSKIFENAFPIQMNKDLGEIIYQLHQHPFSCGRRCEQIAQNRKALTLLALFLSKPDKHKAPCGEACAARTATVKC